MNNSAAYILALRDTPGAGVVAAGRLAEHFKSPDELAACPIEQVILRLKRIPNAEALATRLRGEIHGRFAERSRDLQELQSQGIETVSFLDDLWPEGLRNLDRSDRPLVLFCYGNLVALSLKRISFFAAPPLDDQSFELSQSAVRRLTPGCAAVCGATSGFDVVVTKIGASAEPVLPVIMVAATGLRKMERSVRPAATTAVRNGGLLLSPFEMDHGPFAHDHHARVLVQAAMSHANVFVSPSQDSAEHRAMDWSIAAGRPTFQIGGASLTSSAHFLSQESDLDWLIVAVNESAPVPPVPTTAATKPSSDIGADRQ